MTKTLMLGLLFVVCVYVGVDSHLWRNDNHEEAKHEEEHDDLQGGDIAPHPFDTAHPLLFNLCCFILFFGNKGFCHIYLQVASFVLWTVSTDKMERQKRNPFHYHFCFLVQSLWKITSCQQWNSGTFDHREYEKSVSWRKGKARGLLHSKQITAYCVPYSVATRIQKKL